jgi:hypothetical protein
MVGNTVPRRTHLNFFAYVAFWQFLAFLVLICLVWVSEVIDLPNLFFATQPERLNLFRASVITAAAIVCAIITVGHTYLQQRHVLKGLLIVCTACKKVRIERGAWEDMDRYLKRMGPIQLRNDLCPECHRTLGQKITAANDGQWKAGQRNSVANG